MEPVERCPVCMEHRSEIICEQIILDCTHVICIDCIKQLLKHHIGTCPLCRTDFIKYITSHIKDPKYNILSTNLHNYINPSNREDATYEDTGREDATYEDTGREDATYEDTGREDATYEDTGREDATYEDTGREDATYEDTGREDATYEDTGREESYQYPVYDNNGAPYADQLTDSIFNISHETHHANFVLQPLGLSYTQFIRECRRHRRRRRHSTNRHEQRSIINISHQSRCTNHQNQRRRLGILHPQRPRQQRRIRRRRLGSSRVASGELSGDNDDGGYVQRRLKRILCLLFFVILVITFVPFS